jgi:hypothetical protein
MHAAGRRCPDRPAASNQTRRRHKLEVYLDEYISAAAITDDEKGPLFRTAVGKTGTLTNKPMYRIDAYRMTRRRRAHGDAARPSRPLDPRPSQHSRGDHRQASRVSLAR